MTHADGINDFFRTTAVDLYDEVVLPYRAKTGADRNAPEWVYGLAKAVMVDPKDRRNDPQLATRVRTLLTWCERGDPDERSRAFRTYLMTRLDDRPKGFERLSWLLTMVDQWIADIVKRELP